MADTASGKVGTFDAAQAWREQKAQDEAQFVSDLLSPDPHTMEMNLPAGLMEDGAA